MSAWKPTDEQKYDLGAAIGRHVFQKLGVPVGSQTMPLTYRIIDSPAFQSIIRAAQADTEERVQERLMRQLVAIDAEPTSHWGSGYRSGTVDALRCAGAIGSAS